MTENRQHFSSVYDVTQVNLKEFIYTWKIINFLSIGDDVLFAPITNRRVESQEENLWAVYVYRDGNTDQAADYVSVEVTFFGNKELEDNTFYCLSISIIDINGKEHEAYVSTRAEKGTEITIENFMKKDFMMDEKNGLLPNGDLTLRFKAYFTEQIINHPPLAKPHGSRLNEPTFLGLESILYDKKFSDTKIIAGDKDFYVYKGILASRSPVFAGMFAKDVEEKNIENVVKITDIKYETMQEVLRFIYTGKVNNIKSIASDLLIAADKYQIEELKLLCEEELINNVNVENVIGLLIHAEKYKATNLKTIALDFFKFHAKEIIKNKKYKADLKNLLPVLPDIFEALI